ncbi:ABC transporter permease [Parafilimonas terrae]|uniref:ABC-2 type transport system permease protein n=1 Tax=Parafilimonas terrae TaxID=1465490 RepID=A0A1I5S551_9BACT|nr:ABC transporter permease [Parafilimonas terrae]SFP65850.1 ABC-2 type transport system permease protein [Parafilimonas terrae]
MNKIALIARREFLTRVQKKTFLLTTILLPLLFFGFYAMIIYFSVNSDEKYNIAVADEANVFNNKLEGDENISFSFVKGEDEQSLKQDIEKDKYQGYAIIPANANILDKINISIVTQKSVGLMSRGKIEDKLNAALEQQRLLALNISPAQLDSAKKEGNIQFSTVEGKNDSGEEIGMSYAIGYVSGFLIYIVLFIYGAMVMRGVMEEKVSRIAEVIVSSVKPFQLMMGKILGIGAVGLVQFIIWIILMTSLNFLLPLIFPQLAAQMHDSNMQNGAMQAADTLKNSGLIGNVNINMPLILGCFIFYFIGGYLLYSSLFACVGSAVNEDPQDAQSLMLPITMPIIFGIVIMTKAVNEPTSGLAVFGSLFPLFSPIVMMARIAHGVGDVVPVWQLLTSMGLLIVGFIFTTWFAGKVYRTGILMYGKKPSWKEMWKWAFRRY